MALTKITSRILDSSGVTILGTIATGVWQGTAINQTYLVGQSGTNTGDETLARINALDVTELGTISSGVWQGSVIASAYLDADTAHLNAVQTFTGAKTFSGNVRIGTGTNHALFAADGVYVQGSQNGYLVSPADWRFYSGGTLKMTLQSGGNLGIGTSTMNQFVNIKSTSNTNSAIQFKTANDSQTLNLGVISSKGYITMESAADLQLGTSGLPRLVISSGGDVTLNGNGTTSALLFGQSSYARIINTSGQTLYVDSDTHEFRTNAGGAKLTITSGGEYSFGTPSGVTYGHGSNDGFHLRTGLELGFGNGNNNRPDFGINATGSGGGASLNIYCGEGSDDIDIQISPGAVMQFNSGGIKFGSSGETLSSYEEGTFSPNLQKNDSSGSGQLISGDQTRVGRYVRVGKQCAIWIYVYMTAANAPATTHNTSWLVQGLPFTFRGSTPYQFLPCGYAMISGTQVNQHVRLQINNSTDSGIIYARHHIDSNNNNGGVIEFTFAGVLEIN